MNLTGLHLLTTYQCTLECDHCFVWGSPWQTGTMTLANVRHILDEASRVDTVRWIYFEGGEPFLYYAHLLEAIRMAKEAGFAVGLVSNGYWATSAEDARAWLRPMAGLVSDLSISSDLYHWSEEISRQSVVAQEAAQELDIPLGVISIAAPEANGSADAHGQLPIGQSGVMYRGRAAAALASRAELHPWESFDACLDEDLREPGRVHIDPLGNLHVCQGLAIGNIYERSLKGIIAGYAPDDHPIVGPLLAGGPAALVRDYDLPHSGYYADECHLCDDARRALRTRFPRILGPDQMYGVPDG